MLNEEEGILLEASWERLAGDSPQARAVGRELLTRWSEPHRRYHTLTHLWATLRAVDILAEEAVSPDLVRYAVWFHDAVYETEPGLDEDRSAGLARELLPMLGLAPERVGEVARLVLMTREHAPGPDDSDGQVLSDADLSVLAGAPDEYLAYTAAVRAEYRRVPEEAFREGRSRVLRGMLDAPQIFHTEFGRIHWEARARSNMLAELDRLAAEAASPDGPRSA
ncbi:metal-dependent phosphohydrolase [Nocardiopsis changdeensis]|uniref:Metal-dependent phosphohydrolase n=1 Tax=Nocardiopsis changdeensis TaxID=2831969 RepID=A0ABX8BIW7_9ACTN|nr:MULTISPECIES: metal-dependent phosphohydrolase [Nocardiopsis]QUX21363.1 metal-dependent phosphohydrolase [Nocardiopsis changdeensis]QYX37294.1 metal-dependent phosphohydrolase [Nocardiopsis sp. MT53]